MMSPQLPQGFGSVDGGEDPLAFVSYVDAVSALSSAQAYKQLTLLMLRVSEGNRVLDVGCGTGEDARALAQVVGPRGWVVGIDNSRTMIEEATRRQNGLGAPVEFYVGDACQIAFPDGVFDACRADRVFQHLREPRKALSEMIRVTRRGGRIVVSDPDWGTFIVNSPDRDLTHRIVGFACDATTDGWMGRQLPGLFREVGLQEVQVRSSLVVIEEYDTAKEVLGIEWLARGAAQAGVITPGEAERWLRGLQEDHAAGRFICGLGGFAASGIKP